MGITKSTLNLLNNTNDISKSQQKGGDKTFDVGELDFLYSDTNEKIEQPQTTNATLNLLNNTNDIFKPQQKGGDNTLDVGELDFLYSDTNDKIERPQLTNPIESDSVNSEEFLDLLKSKISTQNNTQQPQKQNLSESSSDISINFITAPNQSGGNIDINSDVDTMMNVANEYFKQHGGFDDSDDEKLESSDDELEDSDKDLDDSDDKLPELEKPVTKNPIKRVKAKKITKMKKSPKRVQKSVNAFSDSIESSDYPTSSAESFGQSNTDTPYINESDSVNTSSINLVSFENPALATNIRKSKKTKRQKN
jgi:hypothetical protein